MNLIDWARARRPDIRVKLGMLAVECHPYRREQNNGLPAMMTTALVDGLSVWSLTTGHRAIWHSGSGWYGFLDLPTGAHRLAIVDPARRYLDRTVDVHVASRDALRTALLAGQLPTGAPTFQPVRLPLRPTIMATGLQGTAFLHGWVATATRHRGAPYVLVEASTMVSGVLRRYVTWTDLQGAWLLALPGLSQVGFTLPPLPFPRADADQDGIPDVLDADPVLPPTVTVTLRMWRPVFPIDLADPLASFPADVDALAASPATIPPSRYSLIPTPPSVPALRSGTRQKINDVFIPDP